MSFRINTVYAALIDSLRGDMDGSNDSDFYPFTSKMAALGFVLLNSLRSMVFYSNVLKVLLFVM